MKTSRWIRFVSCMAILLGGVIAVTSCTEEKRPAPVKPKLAIAAPDMAPMPVITNAPPAAKPLAPSTVAASKKNSHVTVGWVENVVLDISEMKVKAKLDTGAKTSSIRAKVIKVFKKDGKNRVLYSVAGDDGEDKIYDSPLRRWVKIKKKEGGFVRRPVITMEICLAGQMLKGEVNLADRPNMIYPVLIGRNMLQDKFVLNPGKTFLSKPVCKAPAA